MARVKPVALTKSVRACLEAARAALGKGWTVTVEHGGRHAVHLHVVHEATGGLWRIPVSNGGNTCEVRAKKLIERRCREIVTGKWGRQGD